MQSGRETNAESHDDELMFQNGSSLPLFSSLETVFFYSLWSMLKLLVVLQCYKYYRMDWLYEWTCVCMEVVLLPGCRIWNFLWLLIRQVTDECTFCVEMFHIRISSPSRRLFGSAQFCNGWRTKWSYWLSRLLLVVRIAGEAVAARKIV